MAFLSTRRRHAGSVDPSAVAHSMAAAEADTIRKAWQVSAALRGSGALRAALSQGQPGQWASDHRKETDHFTGWNYVAIRAIALQAARAKVHVYQDVTDAQSTDEDEFEPVPRTHPLRRLYKRPSPTQSGASFRYETVIQLALTGTCIIYKARNAFGLTVERYVVPTAAAVPVPPQRGYPRGGWRIQPFANSTTWDDNGFIESSGYMSLIGQTLPAEDFLVIRWPHPLFKDDGYGALAAGAKWTDTSEMLDESRWAHLHNGPDPSIIVSPPDGVDPDVYEVDRAEAKFNSKYCGPAHHGKAIFAAHSTITPVSTSPKDMSYGEAFDQFRNAIMALHGVSPVAAGITEGGSYAAFYASLLQTTYLTVQPYLSLIAEEETEQQAPEFGPNLVVEIEADSINDPDLLERQIATDITGGSITRNEIRAIRGRAPLPGPLGDELAAAAVPPAPGMGGEGFSAGPLDAGGTGMEGVGAGGAGGVPASMGLGTGNTGADVTRPNAAEFKDGNRMQFLRTLKNTQDVLTRVAAGDISDVFGIEMLAASGMDPDRARRLVEAAQIQFSGSASDAGEPLVKSHGAARDASFIMAMLPAELAVQCIDFAEGIPDGLLCQDCRTPREYEPHITILGAIAAELPDRARLLCQRLRPLTAVLGRLAVFPNAEHDVLHIEVTGDSLEHAHRVLAGSIANNHRHANYRPHVTLAYLQPGAGARWVGRQDFAGLEIPFEYLHFSNRHSDMWALELAGNAAKNKRQAGDDWMRKAAAAAGSNGNGKH